MIAQEQFWSLLHAEIAVGTESEIGRMLEQAVIDDDDELFNAILQYHFRDFRSTFGMKRAAVYAARFGYRHRIDAMLGVLTMYELSFVNVLMRLVIGASLETQRYELAFHYWQLKANMNQRAEELQSNVFKNREYSDEKDRIGRQMIIETWHQALPIAIFNAPETEPLSELLSKIAEKFDFNVVVAERRLTELKSTSPPFWERPERDLTAVYKEFYMPDYVKQRHPDLYPEFAGQPPLPIPDGWVELKKAMYFDLKRYPSRIAQQAERYFKDWMLDMKRQQEQQGQ